jgi:hypothetical protein
MESHLFQNFDVWLVIRAGVSLSLIMAVVNKYLYYGRKTPQWIVLTVGFLVSMLFISITPESFSSFANIQKTVLQFLGLYVIGILLYGAYGSELVNKLLGMLAGKFGSNTDKENNKNG